jgi:hypothetical protein
MVLFGCDFPRCQEDFEVDDMLASYLPEGGPDFCAEHMPVDPEDKVYSDTK